MNDWPIRLRSTVEDYFRLIEQRETHPTDSEEYRAFGDAAYELEAVIRALILESRTMKTIEIIRRGS